MQGGRTWQLKLSQSPTTAEVVLIFIHFAKTRTVLCVVLVSTPVFLGAMSRPPAVWTFESNRLRMRLCVSMYMFMLRSTDRTWRKRLDSFSSSN